MSTVFKAADAVSGQSYVIKAYHKAKMQQKHLHKLAREVESMQAMQGEYVVALHATFQVSSFRGDAAPGAHDMPAPPVRDLAATSIACQVLALPCRGTVV